MTQGSILIIKDYNLLFIYNIIKMSFASNPNPSYNTIRGLTILISDIRNCTTKMDEVKRVEQELEKIRKKFGSSKGVSGYDKKKYIWKLLYIFILGYKIDFGHNYMADLITSIKFSEKITGYISMSNINSDFRCFV